MDNLVEKEVTLEDLRRNLIEADATGDEALIEAAAISYEEGRFAARSLANNVPAKPNFGQL
jgi:hypothetical protein